MRLANRNLLGKFLEERGLNNIGIEIGVATGNFSEVLLKVTKLQKIYFLDAWMHFPDDEYKDPCNASQKNQDARYQSVIKRLSPYGDRVEIMRKDCREAVKDFADEYFDFIYIDANHEYSHIKRDLDDWYPKVKVGGVYAGHDYLTIANDKKPCGVKQAVNEFCQPRGLKLGTTGGTRRIPGSWFLVKE